MSKRLKTYIANTFWRANNQTFAACLKFISIPLLLKEFGKQDYGMIVVAMSLSGYLHIISLGLPVGIVRHAANWIGLKDWKTLRKCSSSAFVIFILVGMASAVGLVSIAIWGINWFKIPEDSLPIFRWMVLITAVSSFTYWSFCVLDQLLQALEEIAWLARVRLLVAIFQFLLVITVIHWHMNILVFFIGQLLAIHLLIPAKLLKLQKYIPVVEYLKFKFYWDELKPVLKFSLGLFVLMLCQISVIQLRPIILALRAGSGIGAAAEYRVLFQITQFVMIIKGWFSEPLLPTVTKAVAENDNRFVENVAYRVTKYTWIMTILPVMGLILCAKPLLIVYVGTEYTHLSKWLVVWLLSFVGSYLGPMSSIILARGRIKSLVIFTPFAAIITIIVYWLLAPSLDVGAISVGALTYSLLNIGFYNIVYVKRLGFDSGRLLREAFLPPFLCGVCMMLIVRVIMNIINIQNNWLWIISAALMGFVIYITLTFLFVIGKSEARNLLELFKSK